MCSIDVTIRGIPIKFKAWNWRLIENANFPAETEILDFIDQIPPGGVFLDVGACEGRFSIYAALKGLKVYAIEPEDANYDCLLQNIKANNVNVETFKLALGDQDFESYLEVRDPAPGGHLKTVKEYTRTSYPYDLKGSLQQGIHVWTLDSFLIKFQVPLPEYVKVDIDGAELAFLKGAENSLRFGIKRLVIELDLKDTFREAIQLLKRRFQIIDLYLIEETLYNVVFERIL